MTGKQIDGKMANNPGFDRNMVMQWRLYKEKLLWLRLNQGWSQEEAAHRCGAPDKKTYHLWETGKIERPQARNLKKIIGGFHLESVDDIVLKPIDVPALELSSLYNAHFNLPHNEMRSVDRAAVKPAVYKLICFDTDATLIHGLEFSTRVIWDALGDDDNQRKLGLRSYYKGQFTYQQWCLWIADIFKQKGLTRQHYRDTINQYHMAPHLREGLQQLKDHGYKLAIISNGLGGFLDELFPDWSQYFDYEFVNRLIFSDNGLVQSVIPSPYSIDKKVSAIRYLCEKEKITTDNVIFVGSTFLNRQVAFQVGLTIAYAQPSREMSDLFDEVIKGDDFRKVVKLVLQRSALATR